MFNNKLDGEAEEVAKKMPNGINTYINLDQLNLSGGQRQKIVLARTKVYGSKLLLIDEKATLKILKNILQGPETIVFIAHNWSKELHDIFDREIYLQDNK